MTPPQLGLVTLRCREIEASAGLYGALGFEFARHRHGVGLPAQEPGRVLRVGRDGREMRYFRV